MQCGAVPRIKKIHINRNKTKHENKKASGTQGPKPSTLQHTHARQVPSSSPLRQSKEPREAAFSLSKNRRTGRLGEQKKTYVQMRVYSPSLSEGKETHTQDLNRRKALTTKKKEPAALQRRHSPHYLLAKNRSLRLPPQAWHSRATRDNQAREGKSWEESGKTFPYRSPPLGRP